MKNIVMIYCDELRCDALGCYGNPYGIKTPNIDSLAERGTIFDNCFCSSPVCVPSRYGMLTGKDPVHTGVYHNEAALPSFRLKEEHVTFPEILSSHGWKTASFGKTHLPPRKTPVFDVENHQGGSMNLGIQIKSEAKNIMSLPGTFQSVLAADYPEDKKYDPEWVTDNGLEWMKEQTKPFFIRFSYLQPHTPIVVPREYTERLDDISFDDTVSYYETSRFERRFGEVCDISGIAAADAARMRKYYYAMVLWIDDQVKRIRETLEELGIMEETDILFTADHGASRGENGALAKQTFRPESHRIPLIICSDAIRPGRRRDMCSNLSVAPAVLRMCGLKSQGIFDGCDLAEEEGGPGEIYSIVGYGMKSSRAFPNKVQGTWYGERGWPQRACIRTERYRLDLNTRLENEWAGPEDEDLYFTDRAADPDETRNLAGEPEYREIVRTMREKLITYSRRQRRVEEAEVYLDGKILAEMKEIAKG